MYITEERLLKYALYSNAVYVFLLFLFKPEGISVQKVFITSFLAFSVISTAVIAYRNRKEITDIPSIAKKTVFFLLLWSIIVIIRGFSFKIQDWVTNFGNVYMALAWMTPLFIIIGQKLSNWRVVFSAILFMFQLMLIAFLFLPFYLGHGKLKTEWTWLLRPINFVLIIGFYRFKVLGRSLLYLTFIIYLIIAIKSEQRIEFIFLTILIFLLFIIRIKQIKIKRKMLKYVIASFTILLILIFTYGYEPLSNVVLYFVDYQDTRVFLYNELFHELSLKEEIFGRGSLGTYYSHFMEHTKWYTEEILKQRWWGDSSDRITIEVGYLQMILKGGFLLFIPIVFLMTYASYLALFKSNNKFVKRLGVFILIISILSLISFRPAFTPTFILLWTAVGTVLNKTNRMMSDEDVNKIIKIN